MIIFFDFLRHWECIYTRHCFSLLSLLCARSAALVRIMRHLLLSVDPSLWDFADDLLDLFAPDSHSEEEDEGYVPCLYDLLDLDLLDDPACESAVNLFFPEQLGALDGPHVEEEDIDLVCHETLSTISDSSDIGRFACAAFPYDFFLKSL
ncbi:putative E1A [red squirrel adenovirus 1]|uniref:Putative E1A n=1 Tax=red squirrel adenovirus 1 TaxID=2773314 RepID=A0A220A458_9ADEN|nr:putative E1A [red squirrel adenovirus 1]ARE31876.1 putative E1A [red squirrel adenovirus 1]